MLYRKREIDPLEGSTGIGCRAPPLLCVFAVTDRASPCKAAGSCTWLVIGCGGTRARRTHSALFVPPDSFYSRSARFEQEWWNFWLWPSLLWSSRPWSRALLRYPHLLKILLLQVQSTTRSWALRPRLQPPSGWISRITTTARWRITSALWRITIRP